MKKRLKTRKRCSIIRFYVFEFKAKETQSIGNSIGFLPLKEAEKEQLRAEIFLKTLETNVR